MLITTSGFLFTLDNLQRQAGTLCLNAWLAHRREPLTHVTLFINSKVVAERVELASRPDVLKAIGGVAPHSMKSGLAVAAPIGEADMDGIRDSLQIVAFQDSRTIGLITTPIRDFDRERERLPSPPPVLAERVGGNQAFLQTGLRAYSDIKLHVERHRRFSYFRSVLDWGCGCGRIMRYAIEDFPAPVLYGCDIDADALTFAAGSIQGPSFTRVPSIPPTSYPDESFDFIYGISIFTHLTEDVQKRWLDELRRIARSGAIVAVSVLGELGAPADVRSTLQHSGFADVLSPQSAEFAPYSTSDYYRVAYHSKQYILEIWSKYMNVLEYVEFGINSHQDLVIMQKREPVDTKGSV